MVCALPAERIGGYSYGADLPESLIWIKPNQHVAADGQDATSSDCPGPPSDQFRAVDLPEVRHGARSHHRALLVATAEEVY